MGVLKIKEAIEMAKKQRCKNYADENSQKDLARFNPGGTKG